MGDPWGMIYGGSGFWKNRPGDEDDRANRDAAARFYKAGVRSVRMGVCWCNVEEVRGTYDWSGPDAKLPPVSEMGFHIVLCVATTPRWAWQRPEAEEIFIKRGQANLAGCLPHKPEYWPDYERYLTALVKRYKKYVRHYEIWNEPDGMAGFRFHTDEAGKLLDVWYGGDPAWYAELVKRSYGVIKSIDPRARVGIGSFVFKDYRKPESTWFFKGLYEHGIKDHFDAISIHPYGDKIGKVFARGWLGVCRQIMVEHGDGDKPMWITEYSLDRRGLGMAFETRRKLRLLRETPWISVALPLVFNLHFDQKANPGGWSLAAHKQMTQEYGPRDEFTADFEGPVLKLLNRWEWDATGDGGVKGPEIRSEYPHEGEFCLLARTSQKTVRIWFTPYVKAKDRAFSGYLLVEPVDRDAKLVLSVGVESGDILQDIHEVRPYLTKVPARKWFRFEFALDEHFPEFKDLAVVTCYLEVQSDKPGLSVSIDDVRVGTRQPAGRGR